MTEKNYFMVLGVDRDASADDIRRAHRALIKKVHADNGSAPDEKRHKEVNEAWKVLSDPGRRAEHEDKLEDRERHEKADKRRQEKARKRRGRAPSSKAASAFGSAISGQGNSQPPPRQPPPSQPGSGTTQHRPAGVFTGTNTEALASSLPTASQSKAAIDEGLVYFVTGLALLLGSVVYWVAIKPAIEPHHHYGEVVSDPLGYGLLKLGLPLVGYALVGITVWLLLRAFVLQASSRSSAGGE